MKVSVRTLVTMVFAGLFGFSWVGWDFRQPIQKPQPFDAEVWVTLASRDLSSDPGCLRGGMALDLIVRELLLGKTATQAVSLLGSPTSSQLGYWAYDLGQCSGWGWSNSELRLKFDKSAEVTNASFY